MMGVKEIFEEAVRKAEEYLERKIDELKRYKKAAATGGMVGVTSVPAGWATWKMCEYIGVMHGYNVLTVGTVLFVGLTGYAIHYLT